MDYYSRKNPGGGGHQGHGMGFLGRGIEKFQGPIKKKSGIPKIDQDKITRNFHGFWFLVYEYPKGISETHWQASD